jgi:O-acetylserine/cysteine efflux transporter
VHEVSRLRGTALVGATAFLWGCVPIAGKVALLGLSAPGLTVLRLGSAAAVLALLLRLRPKRPPRLVLVAGLGLGTNHVLYMWGLERAGAGTSQVLIQTALLFLIAIGVLVLGERPTRREYVGAVLALLGVGIVSWQETTVAPEGLAGVFLVLASAAAWAVYAAAHRWLGRDHASGGTTLWTFLLAALVVAPAVPFAPARQPGTAPLLAAAFLCLVTLVSYWSFGEALRHIPATTAAVITTTAPVFTLALLAVTNRIDQGYVPFEPLTFAKLAGSALVVGGVVLAVAAGPGRAAR